MVGFTIVGNGTYAVFFVPQNIPPVIVFGTLPACGITVGIVGVNILTYLRWGMWFGAFVLILQVISGFMARTPFGFVIFLTLVYLVFMLISEVLSSGDDGRRAPYAETRGQRGRVTKFGAAAVAAFYQQAG